MVDVSFGCSGAMPAAATAVKSAPYGASGWREGLCARRREVSTLQHCTIYPLVSVVPFEFAISPVRQSRRDSASGIADIAFDPWGRIRTLGINVIPDCIGA